MSSPSSHIGLARLESRAAKFAPMNARSQMRRENPLHGFWALLPQRTTATAAVLHLRSQPNRFGRYGFVVDEIVSV
jgi:hypothetical protein